MNNERTRAKKRRQFQKTIHKPHFC
jgi:hypothetical protein